MQRILECGTGTGVVIAELGFDLDNPARVPLHDPAVDAGAHTVGAGVKPLGSLRCDTRLAIFGKIRRVVIALCPELENSIVMPPWRK